VNEEHSYHRIADELEPTWLEHWAEDGIAELEAYLEKHAAFLRFLDGEPV
jgi:hypothetical protein